MAQVSLIPAELIGRGWGVCRRRWPPVEPPSPKPSSGDFTSSSCSQNLREGHEVAGSPDLGPLELGSAALAAYGAVKYGEEARKDGRNSHQSEEWGS
jgi:hypothetical protein